MRRSVLVVVLVLAAVPAAAAAAAAVRLSAAPAKEPARGTVCGRNGCATFPVSLQWTGSAIFHRYVVPAPYYRIAVTLPPNVGVDGASGTIIYVPLWRLWRVWIEHTPVWLDVPAQDLAALRHATHGLRPFRAPPRWPR